MPRPPGNDVPLRLGAHSPSTSSKRWRPTLSCTECRKRKLKCDRNQPCSQCEKALRPDRCAYSKDGPDTRSYYSEPRHTPSYRHSSLQKSPVNATLTPWPKLHSTHGRRIPFSGSPSTPDWPPYILKVFEKKTSYLGVGHWTLILREFDQVERLLAKSVQDPSSSKINEDLQSLMKMHRNRQRKKAVIILPDEPDVLPFLFGLLPIKAECDRLVATYCQSQEAIFRVLHLPSFLNECQRFWKNPAQSDPTWLIQYIAVLALASLFDPRQCKRLDVIEYWLDVVSTWIQRLEEISDLNILSAHCLLLIARYTLPYRNARIKDPSGLIAAAIAAGLHREPSKFEELSVYHGERRKRLWSTIMELVVQYSILRNKPPPVRQPDFDTSPPFNINDASIFELTTKIETPPPQSDFTDSSYQYVLANTLSTRLRALEILYTVAGQPDYQEVVSVSESILGVLASLPAELRNEISGASRARPKNLRQVILLNVYLRRPLMVLHSPYLEKWQEDDRFMYSRQTAVNSATSILSHLAVIESDQLDSASRTALQNELLEDIFYSALILCLEIQTVRRRENDSDSLDKAQCLLDHVERAQAHLISRLPLPRWQEFPMHLCMVLAVIKSPTSLEVAEIRARADLRAIISTLREALVDNLTDCSGIAQPTLVGCDLAPYHTEVDNSTSLTQASQLEPNFGDEQRLIFDEPLGFLPSIVTERSVF